MRAKAVENYCTHITTHIATHISSHITVCTPAQQGVHANESEGSRKLCDALLCNAPPAAPPVVK